MRLRLEPWSPAYDTSIFDAAGLEKERPRLDLGVELGHWGPVQTQRPGASFERLYFVDGTRRLEAKVFEQWEEDGLTHTAPGMLGTYAAGLAEVDARRPEGACRVLPGHLRLARVLILGGGRAGEALEIPATGSRLGRLRYEPETVPESHDKENALELKLQALMREAERALAHEVVVEGDLLIVDGPLPSRKVLGALGYVKTLHDLMLPPAEQRALFALQRGQRTPVFQASGVIDRFCWFLRLDKGVGWHQGLSGVVRLEVHAGNGRDWALKVADWSCQNLPRFCAKGFRDPRAPQQLMPVAFLEAELARRMGDAGIVRRRIQAYLHERYGAEDDGLDALFEPAAAEGVNRELN